MRRATAQACRVHRALDREVEQLQAQPETARADDVVGDACEQLRALAVEADHVPCPAHGDDGFGAGM